MIKAVIFDFFGVIGNDQYNEWLKSHGLTRTGRLAEISRSADLGQATMGDVFASLAEIANTTPELVQSEFRSCLRLNDGVVELVKKLKGQGLKLGLLSNSSSEWIREILAKYELEFLFDEIVISAEVGLVKPDAEIFQLMAKKLRVDPAEAVFIDDRIYNVEASRQAGFIGVHFQDGSNLGERLESELRS